MAGGLDLLTIRQPQADLIVNLCLRTVGREASCQLASPDSQWPVQSVIVLIVILSFYFGKKMKIF